MPDEEINEIPEDAVIQEGVNALPYIAAGETLTFRQAASYQHMSETKWTTVEIVGTRQPMFDPEFDVFRLETSEEATSRITGSVHWLLEAGIAIAKHNTEVRRDESPEERQERVREINSKIRQPEARN